MEENRPNFIHSDSMISDTTYLQWLSEIKSRFQQSQIKAAIRINSSMLEFYWKLGRDIVAMKAEQRWGSHVIEQLSLDLKASFSSVKGFSTRTIRYAKQWYLFYSKDVTLLHQLGAEITSGNGDADSSILHQLGAKSVIAENYTQRETPSLHEMPEFFSFVPWRHHVEIVTKCSSVEEALFYLRKVVTEGWSRSFLQANSISMLLLPTNC